jgi:hypothetical protein
MNPDSSKTFWDHFHHQHVSVEDFSVVSFHCGIIPLLVRWIIADTLDESYLKTITVIWWHNNFICDTLFNMGLLFSGKPFNPGYSCTHGTKLLLNHIFKKKRNNPFMLPSQYCHRHNGLSVPLKDNFLCLLVALAQYNTDSNVNVLVRRLFYITTVSLCCIFVWDVSFYKSSKLLIVTWSQFISISCCYLVYG